jgi:OPT oligopeptide transporter protein
MSGEHSVRPMHTADQIDQTDPQDKAKPEKVAVTITEKARDEEDSLEDEGVVQSRFLEVQAGVDAGEDDVEMPAETFRAYTLGLSLTLVAASISNICDLREQPLSVDPGVVQLVALPLGRWWAKYIPDKTVSLWKWSFKLNPGPFNVKEHTLIVAMANVGTQPPYVVGLILAQMTKFGYISRCRVADFRPALWVSLQPFITHWHRDAGLWTCWVMPKVARLSQ